MKHAAYLSCCLIVAACGSHTTPMLYVDGGDPSNVDGGDEVFATMYVHTRDTLYTVNNQNFDLEFIGNFELGNVGITDLAVTPDGVVYGISNDSLYTINAETGQATMVTSLNGSTSNVGLTFLNNGELLIADKDGNVLQLDPNTGDVDKVGEFGSGYTTAGDLVAISDGTMFAISDGGSQNADVNNWLITVDPNTGVASGVGQISYGEVYGAAVTNNHVYAFTALGEIIEINPHNGIGTLRRTHEGIEFWGAGVTPKVTIID